MLEVRIQAKGFRGFSARVVKAPFSIRMAVGVSMEKPCELLGNGGIPRKKVMCAYDREPWEFVARAKREYDQIEFSIYPVRIEKDQVWGEKGMEVRCKVLDQDKKVLEIQAGTGSRMPGNSLFKFRVKLDCYSFTIQDID